MSDSKWAAARSATIQADFDRIALLSTERWNSNSHYYNFLLRRVPAECQETLEIGCGTGSLTRLLAQRSKRVLALDLSPEMVRIAREQCAEYPNIDFQIADVVTWEFPKSRFDCIVTSATLHHLPLKKTLERMKPSLRTDGVLLVLDLFQAEGLSEAITGALAAPVSFGLRLIHGGRLRASREAREAWAEHDKHDTYPTLNHVRRICAEILPDAKVKRHLLWRYSIVWRK